MTYSLSWYIPSVAGILILPTGPVDRNTFHSSPLPFFALLCISPTLIYISTVSDRPSLLYLTY